MPQPNSLPVFMEISQHQSFQTKFTKSPPVNTKMFSRRVFSKCYQKQYNSDSIPIKELWNALLFKHLVLLSSSLPNFLFQKPNKSSKTLQLLIWNNHKKRPRYLLIFNLRFGILREPTVKRSRLETTIQKYFHKECHILYNASFIYCFTHNQTFSISHFVSKLIYKF